LPVRPVSAATFPPLRSAPLCSACSSAPLLIFPAPPRPACCREAVPPALQEGPLLPVNSHGHQGRCAAPGVRSAQLLPRWPAAGLLLAAHPAVRQFGSLQACRPAVWWLGSTRLCDGGCPCAAGMHPSIRLLPCHALLPCRVPPDHCGGLGQDGGELASTSLPTLLCLPIPASLWCCQPCCLTSRECPHHLTTPGPCPCPTAPAPCPLPPPQEPYGTLFVSIPSLLDPSLCPEGTHVFHIFT
jgi:hypothetical protein